MTKYSFKSSLHRHAVLVLEGDLRFDGDKNFKVIIAEDEKNGTPIETPNEGSVRQVMQELEVRFGPTLHPDELEHQLPPEM